MKKVGGIQLAGIALIFLFAAACTASIGEVGISGESLSNEISTELTEVVGFAPDQVDCPSDLGAEAGESVRCNLSAGGEKYGITVTSTGLSSDGEVKFDFKIDSSPSG